MSTPTLYARISRHLPVDNSPKDTETICRLIEDEARRHVRLQTEQANGVRRSILEHAAEVEDAESRLRMLVARIPGGPWQVEFQGRGGGLYVVIALASEPDTGDGWGGGWNVGGGFVSRTVEIFDPPCARCPLCGHLAICKLPPLLLAAQPDGTTHACNPAHGGCNVGFIVDDRGATLALESPRGLPRSMSLVALGIALELDVERGARSDVPQAVQDLLDHGTIRDAFGAIGISIRRAVVVDVEDTLGGLDESPLRQALTNIVGKGAQHEHTCDQAEHDEDGPCIWCAARAALEASGIG